MTMEAVRLVEVGARDGLQNEAMTLPVAVRVELIERLVAAGLQTLEAGAFVSPRWVPQLADATDLLAARDIHLVAAARVAARIENLHIHGKSP